MRELSIYADDADAADDAGGGLLSPAVDPWEGPWEAPYEAALEAPLGAPLGSWPGGPGSAPDACRHQRNVEALEFAYQMRTHWDQQFLEALAQTASDETHLEMGYCSVPEFIAGHLNMGYRRACEFYEVGMCLSEHPPIKDSYQKGKIGFDHLRALSWVATPDNRDRLVEKAESATVAATFREARRLRPLDADDSKDARAARHLAMSWDQDFRMLSIWGRFPEDQGGRLKAAIDSAAAKMPEDPGFEPYSTPMGAKRADALFELVCSQGEQMLAPSEVVVHLEAAASGPSADGAADASSPSLSSSFELGVAEIEDGPTIAHATLERLLCDAAIKTVVENPQGKPIGYGRTKRTAPPRMRRDLKRRDETCRWPCCRKKVLLEAHHIAEYHRDLGETEFDNVVMLCWFHHWLCHEGGFRAEGAPPNLVFRPPASGSNPIPAVKLGPPEFKEEVTALFEGEKKRALVPPARAPAEI